MKHLVMVLLCLYCVVNDNYYSLSLNEICRDRSYFVKLNIKNFSPKQFEYTLLYSRPNHSNSMHLMHLKLFSRLIWNHIVTILSFAINILMLVTWQAKASMGSTSVKVLMQNTTAIPEIVKE